MLITRHACALLTRLLKSLNEPFKRLPILLMCGFSIVASAFQHLKILITFVGNLKILEFCSSSLHVSCLFNQIVLFKLSDRLFKRALSFVGKDYLCHTLWDKYLEFEFSQQRWSSLAHVYIQTLRFPSKRLHNYYDRYISTPFLNDSTFTLACMVTID